MELTLVNVGEDTTLGDGDVAEKLVQLLIVADGELEVTGNDTGLLVVASGVASKLEDFGSQVLKDGSEVDGSAGTDTLSVVALAEETVDTTNGERETGLGRTTRESQLLLRAQDTSENASGLAKVDSRLRVLGARGLATRFAAASHFGRSVVWVVSLGVG